MNPYGHGRGHHGYHYPPPNGRPQDTTNAYYYQQRPRGGHGGYYRPMRQTILNFRGFRDPDTHPLLLRPPPVPEYGYQMPPTLQENNPNLQVIRPTTAQKGPSSFGRTENLQNHNLQENQWQNIRPQGNQSNVRPQNIQPLGNQSNVRPQNIQPLGNQSNVRPQTNPNPGSNQNVWGQIRTTVGPNSEVSSTTQPPLSSSSPQQQDTDMNGVKMTTLPFFEVIGTPLQTMVHSRGPGWNFRCTFSLKESLLNHFKNKSVTAPYFVHLRLCKDDQSDIQKDYFPSDINVLVNNQKCFLPGWNTIPKGTPGPVDITNKCEFLMNHNYIHVRTRERMVLFVNVTKRLIPDDLLKKLLAKAPIEPSATIAKIKEKLQQDSVSGDDITLTSLHFSLLCPVSKARMKYPCRASTCQHLQCFDAAYYFKMNERKPKWICPVCFVVIEHQALQIDQYFKNVLDENISTEKILLQADGTYKPFQSKGGNQSVLTLDDTTETFTVTESRDHNGNAPHTTPVDDTTFSFGGDITGGGGGACVSLGSEDSFLNNLGRGRSRGSGGRACISSDDEDSRTSVLGHGRGGGSGAHVPLYTEDSAANNHTYDSTTPFTASLNNSSNQSDSSDTYIPDPDDYIPLNYKKSSCVNGREKSNRSPSLHKSNCSSGEAQQVTIDLLSEDESMITNAKSASNKASQNRPVPEIVILSDDDSVASPRPLKPSGILGHEFTSTPRPKLTKRRKKKQKAKGTPAMTRIIPDTNTPIDQPGRSPMVLRKRVKRNYVEK